MKNSPKSKSSNSSASINQRIQDTASTIVSRRCNSDLHQLLNKHFFLLFGITSLSLVTITSINWNRFCSTSNYSENSTLSDSLDNTTLTIDNPSSFLTWFYTAIILGCSATPWLLAYLFRPRALSIAQNNLRYYPSASKAQTPKPRSLPNPVLSTSETINRGTTVTTGKGSWGEETSPPCEPRTAVKRRCNGDSPKPAPSYRISSWKSSPQKNKSLAKNTKNIRLPFEKLK